MAIRPEATCLSKISRGLDWAWFQNIVQVGYSGVVAAQSDSLARGVGKRGSDENSPFQVAVKEPYSRVVGSEAQDNVAVGPDKEGVAAHWNLRDGLIVGKVASRFGGPYNSLEGVAVKVEGVFAGIIVVQDDFDSLSLLENKGIGVVAIDHGIGGEIRRSKGCVERRNLWRNVRHIVEEGTALISNGPKCFFRARILLVGAIS